MRIRIGRASPLPLCNVEHHDVERCNKGNSKECARDATNESARRNGENDGQGVDLDNVANDEWLKYVALKLLNSDHDDHHEQRGPRTTKYQRGSDGQNAGQQGTNDRNERPEEDGNSDRQSEWGRKKGRTDPDANSVNGGHEDLHFDEVCQGNPAGFPCSVEGDASTAGNEAGDPVPDSSAVYQDEQGRKQGEQGTGENVAGRRANRQRAREEERRICLCRCERLRNVVADLRIREVQGGAQQQVLEFLISHEPLRLKLRHAAHDLGHHENEQPDHDRDHTELAQGDGKPLRPAMGLEPLGERHKQGGKKQPNKEGNHDEPQLDDQKDDERHDPGNQQDAPRPVPGDLHPNRNRLTAGFAPWLTPSLTCWLTCGLTCWLPCRLAGRLGSIRLYGGHGASLERCSQWLAVSDSRARYGQSTMVSSLSAAQARRIALAAQGFGTPPPATVGTRTLSSLITRLRVLQLDSVNVYERNHYLPVFARLGSYDKALLDQLTFAKNSRYTEYWAHAAAIIPIEDWPLFRWRMEDRRAKHEATPTEWIHANRPMLDWLRAELTAKGALAASEVQHDLAKGKGSWWGWSDVKLGLEYLFEWGEVVAAGRTRFERRYALATDHMPPRVLATEIVKADAIRELVRRAAMALGVGTVSDIADYFRVLTAPTTVAIRELVDAGELVPVTVEGWREPAYLHAAARIPRQIHTVALLSPFDPIVWERDRALRMFGFHYRIEIYTPQPKRQYGYYTLPLLIDDQLVGRIDLKNDRQSRVLRVQSAWREAGRPVDLDRVAGLVRSIADWQGLTDIHVAAWGDLTDDLRGALSSKR